MGRRFLEDHRVRVIGKFLASGAFNTALSYAAYVLLLRVMSYQWAYTIAYAIGIAVAYLLFRYFVFQRSGGRFGPLLVCLIYGLQYLAGIGLVTLWTGVLHLPAILAPAFAIAITLPASFLLNRLVFRGRP
jgi:putative flippase GtrA